MNRLIVPGRQRGQQAPSPPDVCLSSFVPFSFRLRSPSDIVVVLRRMTLAHIFLTADLRLVTRPSAQRDNSGAVAVSVLWDLAQRGSHL